MPLSRVPQFREKIAFTSIVAGAPVASTDWQRAAAVQNWVAGRGRQNVPTFKPDHGSAKNTTLRYSIRVLPSYPSIDIIAMVASENAPSIFPGYVASPSPVSLTFSPRSSYGTSPIDFNLDVVAPAGLNNTSVKSIAVYEVPRAYLEQTASAGGIDTTALAAGQPITAASVEALADALADDTFGTRTLAFHAVPYSDGSSTITTYATASTSATFAAVVGGDGVPVLARKKRVGDTTRTVKARCYGWVSSGATTGQFRVTSSVNGASSAVTFTNPTPAWSNEITDLVVDCEDLSTATGLQSATWDELTCESRRFAGVGTVYVAGWIVYE
jgi:hypothetical protein